MNEKPQTDNSNAPKDQPVRAPLIRICHQNLLTWMRNPLPNLGLEAIGHHLLLQVAGTKPSESESGPWLDEACYHAPIPETIPENFNPADYVVGQRDFEHAATLAMLFNAGGCALIIGWLTQVLTEWTQAQNPMALIRGSVHLSVWETADGIALRLTGISKRKGA